MSNKIRNVFLYKNHFRDFFNKQSQKVKDKILRTFRLIESLDRVPEDYLKYMEGTNGLIMKEKDNLKSLDQFIKEEYGEAGTPKRDKFEEGYEAFRLGSMIQQARLEKGMTQAQLAEKCGTNKGYISKIENDLKEVRLSTLQKIVTLGLGGHLELSIKL